MAKKIELTLAEACKHPECFMYVWATDAFLKAIDPKYAAIISQKRNNQKKVLMLSADKYEGGFDKVTKYYDAIKQAFVDTYGVTPYNALIILAQGGEVAGKNWSEGVFGVGELYPKTFAGVELSDGTKVRVDETTGHIYAGSKDITDESKTVYDDKGAYQLFGVDDFGYVFMSQRRKIGKKYFAKSWTDENGVTHKATNGNETSASDGASIWGNITLNWDWIKSILNWILSIFGIPQIPDMETTTEPISATNTLPEQKTDGFVSQQAGIGTSGAILLAALAAGMLLSQKKNKKNKANK